MHKKSEALKSKEHYEISDLSDLCIYTSTKYGDDQVSQIRYPLAIKTLKNCENLGITTIVVDSSSNEEFLSQLQTIKNIKILHNDEQMGAKRRKALQDAIDNTDAKYFLWMEPEKYDLVKDTSLLHMINGLKSGSNIVVPHRNNIDQMPEFFAWIEKRGIKRANIEAMKSEGEYDLRFGPKMFDRKSAKYFLEYNQDLNRADLGDSHIIPTIQAHKDGLNVQSVEIDYQYDPSEINNELTRELKQKRLDQYKSILFEILKEG